MRIWTIVFFVGLIEFVCSLEINSGEDSVIQSRMAWRAVGSSNVDLINQLRTYGIVTSNRVAEAMKKTDRLLYSKIVDQAYHDAPHPIGYKATISAPHMHAHCLEVLKDFLQPGAKVLDVGCGSGYLTACFARMVGKEGKVIGIDYIDPLVQMSMENVNKDDPTLLSDGIISLKVGDGWKGDPENAPFDCIHVGAAAESIPEALLSQLKKGGRMLIPVGTSEQHLLQVDKKEDGTVEQKPLMGVIYVPLVKSKK